MCSQGRFGHDLALFLYLTQGPKLGCCVLFKKKPRKVLSPTSGVSAHGGSRERPENAVCGLLRGSGRPIPRDWRSRPLESPPGDRSRGLGSGLGGQNRAQRSRAVPLSSGLATPNYRCPKSAKPLANTHKKCRGSFFRIRPLVLQIAPYGALGFVISNTNPGRGGSVQGIRDLD